MSNIVPSAEPSGPNARSNIRVRRPINPIEEYSNVVRLTRMPAPSASKPSAGSFRTPIINSIRHREALQEIPVVIDSAESAGGKHRRKTRKHRTRKHRTRRHKKQRK
jgi:hypothetical protein